MNDIKKHLLKVGYVAATHGIDGALFIKTEKNILIKPGQKIYFDNYKTVNGPFKIKSVCQHKGCFITEITGVSKIEEAQKFHGALVGIKIKRLPEGSWWVEELVGCEVYDISKKKLGVVEQVMKTGANDILVVGNHLIPMLKKIIKSIDVKNKKIVIDILPGLIDEN